MRNGHARDVQTGAGSVLRHSDASRLTERHVHSRFERSASRLGAVGRTEGLASLAFISVLVLSILRDTVLTPDGLTPRIASQLIAVAYTIHFASSHSLSGLAGRYWYFFAYVALAAASSLSSLAVSYSLSQAATLLIMILFFISIVETNRLAALRQFLAVIFYMVGPLCIVGLALWLAGSSIAQESWYYGGFRMKGMFHNVPGLSIWASLLLGVCCFARFPLVLRIVFGGSALLSMVFTQTRTGWVAAAVSAGLAIVLSSRNHLRTSLLMAAVLGIAVLGYFASGIEVQEKSVQGAIRSDSIGNIGGRIGLWGLAWEKALDRPILGHGLGCASLAFVKDGSRLVRELGETVSLTRDVLKGGMIPGHSSMHNGYLQSLLDVGFPGAMFYIFIIISSIITFYQKSLGGENVAGFYLAMVFALTNMTESVIFSAAISASISFWFLAILAFYLRSNSRKSECAV